MSAAGVIFVTRVNFQSVREFLSILMYHSAEPWPVFTPQKQSPESLQTGKSLATLTNFWSTEIEQNLLPLNFYVRHRAVFSFEIPTPSTKVRSEEHINPQRRNALRFFLFFFCFVFQFMNFTSEVQKRL